jgi:hypothetical protein
MAARAAEAAHELIGVSVMVLCRGLSGLPLSGSPSSGT